MKIAIIQASTQVEKNHILFETTQKIANPLGHEVINFGVFEEEKEVYSYTEIAFLISLLLSSEAIDFVITGCSSGQGMMLACNSLPAVLCGFVQNPQDAFLFGRINDGNAISFPLGLSYGWLGDLNLQYSLEKLFDGEFGVGYPSDVAERKRFETSRVKRLNSLVKKDMNQVLREIDDTFLTKVLTKKDVIAYILNCSKNKDIKELLQANLIKGEIK